MRPHVSIGIAAYNEEQVIAKSIACALGSRPAADEVIVVASGCTDGTVGIVRALLRKNKRLKLILEKKRSGKGSAVNLIFRKASGDYVVMTDADLTFPPESIGRLLRKFRSGIGAVSGRPQYFAKSEMFDWWAKFASECASRQREIGEKKGFYAISGYLYAIRKGIVSKIPPSAKSEDAYVGEIVRKKGYLIGYAPDAIVNVSFAENYLEYLTQKVRTHFGHLEVFKAAGAKDPVESVQMAGKMRGEIREYFKVANEYITSPSEFLFFAFYLITEVIIWFIAFLKFYLKGEEEWKQIRSTKKSRI